MRNYCLDPDTVNVKSFGAVGDGIADDTAHINSAIAAGKTVYFPAGRYRVTNALTITTLSQRVFGAGSGVVSIVVPNTFNMTALGVFVMQANAGNSFTTTTSPGPTISDLTIEFDQVDTSVKASLIQFPPAIYITQTQRWQIYRVRTMRGWNGIYAYANVVPGDYRNSIGGGYIDDVQGGCLNTNIYIDGSADSLHINNVHLWPFGCTDSQISIFRDATVGIVIGRADDFHISNMGAYIGRPIQLIETAGGGSYGTITGVDFDSFSGIEIAGSTVTLTSCLFLTGAGRIAMLIHGNSTVTASSCVFSVTSPGAASVQCFPESGTNADLVLSGCHFVIRSANLETPINVNANASPGNSNVTVSGCWFEVDPTVGRGSGLILCQSNTATVVVTGCQVPPKATADPSGPFVQITSGNSHRVMANSAPGWSNIIPAGCAYDYPNFYQQTGGTADLNAPPATWMGFGFRNYISAAAATNWPPHSAAFVSVLDTYVANKDFGVQMSFGHLTDGLWYRWNQGSPTTWQPWYQIVTTYGGMAMQGNLNFANTVGVRLADTSGTAAMTMLVGSDNTFVLNATDATGGVRNVANMLQHSTTSNLIFAAPIQFEGNVGFNFSAPIAKPTVSGAWAGNTAGKALSTALAAYGLIVDATTA